MTGAVAIALALLAGPPQAQAATGLHASIAPVENGHAVDGRPEVLGLGSASDPSARGATLTVVRPHRGRANGTAVVIAPGGAYVTLATALEGMQPAHWFASRGVTAFVLAYRHGETARLPVPVEDGVRAMRLVRSRAVTLGIDPRRVGLMGFSAGGHLAAMVATGAGRGGRIRRIPSNARAPDPTS